MQPLECPMNNSIKKSIYKLSNGLRTESSFKNWAKAKKREMLAYQERILQGVALLGSYKNEALV